ncbi:HAD family hydrolase [Kitasatospora sp. NPDC008050]|uniref:HAD family hydrolase n=1 Tax=Kitasatospora sp. NPDC008050 TaxID=3364021 RepID=UPI0036E1D2A6
MNPTDLHTSTDVGTPDGELLAELGPQAAVFDFDGTLVDTHTVNTDAAHASLTDLGLAVPERWLHTAPLADLTALRQRLRSDLDLRLPCTDGEFVDRTRAHWLTLSDRVRPIARVAALARELAQAVPVAVASANDGQVVRAGLTAADLGGLFEVIVAREHVPRLKPAPDAYLLATAKLAVPPDRCVAFENTAEGLEAARAAGIPVIDIRDTTWAVQRP